MKYKFVSDCIIYFLYYILTYIQHNGDVSLENYCISVFPKHFCSLAPFGFEKITTDPYILAHVPKIRYLYLRTNFR
jgi:hypothetical protein